MDASIEPPLPFYHWCVGGTSERTLPLVEISARARVIVIVASCASNLVGVGPLSFSTSVRFCNGVV